MYGIPIRREFRARFRAVVLASQREAERQIQDRNSSCETRSAVLTAGDAGGVRISGEITRMNWYAQWRPAISVVIASWIGLICNNKRLDDFRDFLKDLLRAEISGNEARIRSEISGVRSDIAG
jgi:hypothetical protein